MKGSMTTLRNGLHHSGLFFFFSNWAACWRNQGFEGIVVITQVTVSASVEQKEAKTMKWLMHILGASRVNTCHIHLVSVIVHQSMT